MSQLDDALQATLNQIQGHGDSPEVLRLKARVQDLTGAQCRLASRMASQTLKVQRLREHIRDLESRLFTAQGHTGIHGLSTPEVTVSRSPLDKELKVHAMMRVTDLVTVMTQCPEAIIETLSTDLAHQLYREFCRCVRTQVPCDINDL